MRLLVSVIIAFSLGLPSTTILAKGGVGASASGPAPSGQDAVIPPGHYGIISSRANAVLSSPHTQTRFASDVLTALDDNSASFFIVDIRNAGDYCKGHIQGAVNIPFVTVAEPVNLEMLPTDRPILVVCYTGHTASQTTMLYNLLGYDASALRFGMMSWVPSTEMAISDPDDKQIIYGGPAYDGRNYPLTPNTCP
jgi:rhodanese-related sulfurtransferase